MVLLWQIKPAQRDLLEDFINEASRANILSYYTSPDCDDRAWIGLPQQEDWIQDHPSWLRLCKIRVIFSLGPSCESLLFENPLVPFGVAVRYCFDVEASLQDGLAFVTRDNGVTDETKWPYPQTPSPVQGPILSRPFNVAAGSSSFPRLRMHIDSTKPLGDYLTLSNPILVQQQSWPACFERNPALPRPKGFPDRLIFDTLFIEFR